MQVYLNYHSYQQLGFFMVSQLSLPLNGTANHNVDWDFAGTNTQYSTHGIHTYLAAMIPQIPHRLLKMYANEDSRILDPFVGGGAVTTEAYLSGINATGIDVNTLAVLISQVKSTPISNQSLTKLLQNFDLAYSDAKVEVPDFSARSNVEYWFKQEVFTPLSRIRVAMEDVVGILDRDEQTQSLKLLQCVYSNTVRSVSLTYRNEIRLRRLQEEDYQKFNPDTFNEFKTRLNTTIERIRLLPQNNVSTTIIEGNSRKLPFANDSFDLVLTSPPYGDLMQDLAGEVE